MHEDVRAHGEITQLLAWPRVSAEYDHLIRSLETQREGFGVTRGSRKPEVEMAILKRVNLYIRVLVYKTSPFDLMYIEYVLGWRLIEIRKVRTPDVPVRRKILQKPIDHVPSTFWTVDRDGSRSAHIPRQSHHCSDVGIVIVMIVRDENMAHATQRYARHCELPSYAASGVNDVRFVIDEEHIGGLSTIFVLHRAAMRAQRDQGRFRWGLLSDGELRHRCSL